MKSQQGGDEIAGAGSAANVTYNYRKTIRYLV